MKQTSPPTVCLGERCVGQHEEVAALVGAMVEKGSGHGPDFFTIDVSIERAFPSSVDIVLLVKGGGGARRRDSSQAISFRVHLRYK